jgi:hypothetical protein
LFESEDVEDFELVPNDGNTSRTFVDPVELIELVDALEAVMVEPPTVVVPEPVVLTTEDDPVVEDDDVEVET